MAEAIDPVCDHLWPSLPDRIPVDDEPCSRCGKTVPELVRLASARTRSSLGAGGSAIEHDVRAVLCGELPAHFEGLVGVYPQAIFRPSAIETLAIEGVSLFVGGQLVPCDGSAYQVNGGTLCLGDALAVDVTNTRPEPVLFRCAFVGCSIGCSHKQIAHGLKLGAKLVRPPVA